MYPPHTIIWFLYTTDMCPLLRLVLKFTCVKSTPFCAIMKHMNRNDTEILYTDKYNLRLKKRRHININAELFIQYWNADHKLPRYRKTHVGKPDIWAISRTKFYLRNTYVYDNWKELSSVVSITVSSAYSDSHHSSSLLLNSAVCLYNANESRLWIPQGIQWDYRERVLCIMYLAFGRAWFACPDSGCDES
jgi:hypothetical protein